METNNTAGKREIFTPYIHRNGRLIWHPTGGVYHFWVTVTAEGNQDPKQLSMFDDDVE